MFQLKVVGNIKTHFVFSNIFIFSENRTVYQIMWKNVIEPAWPRVPTNSRVESSLVGLRQEGCKATESSPVGLRQEGCKATESSPVGLRQEGCKVTESSPVGLRQEGCKATESSPVGLRQEGCKVT
jgi:hypothetical protein